jgi:hypothetical protein
VPSPACRRRRRARMRGRPCGHTGPRRSLPTAAARHLVTATAVVPPSSAGRGVPSRLPGTRGSNRPNGCSSSRSAGASRRRPSASNPDRRDVKRWKVQGAARERPEDRPMDAGPRNGRPAHGAGARRASASCRPAGYGPAARCCGADAGAPGPWRPPVRWGRPWPPRTRTSRSRCPWPRLRGPARLQRVGPPDREAGGPMRSLALGGGRRTRTAGLVNAIHALSQLSYTPASCSPGRTASGRRPASKA